MLTAAPAPRRPMPIDRLAAPSPRADSAQIDWDLPIDRSRWFFCETLTPLSYTRVYRELGPDHRLRYNQLTGMLSNELILLLETEFLAASLNAVQRQADNELRAAVMRFAEDEHRHAATWRRLNQLSAPDWYSTGDRFLCRPGPLTHVLSRIVARHPVVCPVMFWIQLSQEERSVDISRRCLRVPADRMEPHYAAAYRDHVRDEVRHVQIDGLLLERFYANRPVAVKRATAAIFRAILGSAFLRPTRSTVRIVHVLASDFPELKPLVPRMTSELNALVNDDDYQRMMYSRETTPLTFEWFDRCDEFRTVSRLLRTYTPRAGARTS